MAKLCVDDIDRWDPNEIARVFGICTDIQNHCADTSTALASLSSFATWNGYAAEASKDSIHSTRKDLDRHGEMAGKVADAARKAEGEIEGVKDMLTKLRSEAADKGLMINPFTDVVFERECPTMVGWSAAQIKEHNEEIADLQARVNALLAAADAADHDLSMAIECADGDKEDFTWSPSSKDVVLGGIAATEAAKTDIIREIWLKAMGESPKGWDAKIAPWLEDIGKLKGASPVGGAVGVITAIPAVFSDIGEGDSPVKAVAREGGGLALGTLADAGASTGFRFLMSVGATVSEAAAEGGADGTAVLPGWGTALGVVIGAGAGAVAAYLGSKGIDKALGK